MNLKTLNIDNMMNQKFNKIRYFYILAFFMSLCLRNIGIYSFIPPILDSLVFSFLAVSGVGMIFYGIISKNISINFRENLFLILFLGVLVISSVVNFKYEFVKNIKDIIWTSISFFIIYFSFKDGDKSRNKAVFVEIQSLLITFWFSLSVVSIITMFLKLSMMLFVNGDNWIGIGIVEDRLFGVFVNPNSASIVSVLALFFSVFQILSPSTGCLSRKFNILSIIVEFLYIALSESRGSYLVLGCAVLIVSFLIFNHYLSVKSPFLKFLYSALLGLLCCAIVIVLLFGITRFFGSILNFFPDIFSNKVSTSHEKIIRHRIVGERRDFVDNSDISNLRFKIWLSALDVFKNNWFLGVPHGSILEYVKKVMPDTFIAQRGYDRSHSIWIGVPLYTGICGAICLFWYFLSCFIKMAKNYIYNGLIKIDMMMNLCSLIVMCIWIYGLVELEILFVNSVSSFIFWVAFGIMMNNLKSKSYLKNN